MKMKALLSARSVEALIALLLVCQVCASSLAEDVRENLAIGRPVRFAPQPNYRLTAKGETDEADLTDGKLTTRKDDHLWFDSKCVGFSYSGLQQLAVDLGDIQPIEEAAIRFQGGSPQAGICFPGWIDLLVSNDGMRYYKVASYSKWKKGDKQNFGIPRNEGKGWAHKLRFTDLRTRGRFVGLSFYGAGLSVSDEMWVIKGKHDASSVKFDEGQLADFTVDGVQMYFHKPVVYFSTNISTPNPVGLILGKGVGEVSVAVRIDLPRGVRFVGGDLGGVSVNDIDKTTIEGGEYTRYTFSAKVSRSTKTWGRIYITGDWKDGKRGNLRYRVRWGDRESPLVKQAIEAVKIDPAPQPKRLTTGLGWWSLAATISWPDSLVAFRTLGFNTIPLFARWVKKDDAKAWAFLEEFRRNGFKVMNIDSPFHHLMSRRKKEGEIYCQFEDGTHGGRFCPSYRGRFYREELERLASECAKAKADYLSCDIELWNWRGPLDSRKCTRCRADRQKSGKDWKEWQLDKGYEIWTDLSKAVRAAVKQVRGDARIEIGGYDFRPGHNYQYFWPFDRLYPDHIQSSQISIYTPLEPYHLELIGDEVRADRERLSKSDVMPWLTPGDAGTFPGEMFRYALLECFANGSRGLHFWSGRVWDTEMLAAYAHAIRNVEQVEDIIVDGELLRDASAAPPARISGMRHGDEIFVLVADYYATEQRKIKVSLPIKVDSRVIDLDSGKEVAQIALPEKSFTVELADELARVFQVRPW